MDQAYQEKVTKVIKALDTVAFVYGLSLRNSGKTLAIELSLHNVQVEKGETRWL